MSYHLTYLEAVVTGLIQGVTELFPISSLGHNVLLPALIGGSWASTLNVSAPESPYLAFVVGLHVATALAMIAYFWRDWLRIVRGFLSSLRRRSVSTTDERLAWMIILGTIPVGIVGVALQKAIVHVFAKPELAAVFLAVNGVILLLSERMLRTRRGATGGGATGASATGSAAATVPAPVPPVAPPGPVPGWPGPAGGPGPGGYSQQPWQQQQQEHYGRPLGRHAAGRVPSDRGVPAGGPVTDPAVAADRRLATMSYPQALIVGAAQILALMPGISRDGMVTVTGMGRGLRRADAVRFSFLLSAPAILAAGVLKVPDLTGPMGKGIHGPVLAGSLVAGVAAFLSVRFLTKYFSEDKSLSPFGVYCLIAGLGSLAYLVIK
jgi:undecaprenyl-diphosphatase